MSTRSRGVFVWLSSCSDAQLFFVSCLSRLALAVWMMLSNVIAESYDSSEAFYPNEVQSVSFLNHWDSVHFRHIATHGYTHEHLHAFFPGAAFIFDVLDRLGLHILWFNIVSGLCFGAATVVLRALTRRQCCASNSAKTGAIDHMFLSQVECGAAIFLFLCAPASVFTVASYTEAFFALFSFLGLYCNARSVAANSRKESMWWTFPAVVSIMIASCFRSNGFLLGVVIMYPHILEFITHPILFLMSKRTTAPLWQVIWKGLLCCVLLLPFGLHNYLAWSRYCTEEDHDCGEISFHGFYSMIQSKYWEVGLFRQWKMTNSPNFLIAAPPIVFGGRSLWRHLIQRDGLKAVVMSPNVLMLVFLWLLAVTTIHVQVVNRLVFGCAPLYWLGAKQFVSEYTSIWTKAQLAYCLICLSLGPLMFSNHMNWT